ncbi:hypothetical protein ACIOHE_15565 [Streptomyces sp. NPDC087851]|uniref:hypothetical protein n=1 Tax=Streptomyces sp. NPDC087851 TaxID=3365810 RepID=UPI0038294566
MSVDRAPIWDHPDLAGPLAHRLPNSALGLPDPPLPPQHPIPATFRGPNWTPED